MTSGHDEVRERLGAFVLGQLPPEQAETVREHLTGCTDCAAEARSLQPLAGPLSWVDPDDPLPSEPPQLRQRVEQALSGRRGDQSAPDGQPIGAAEPSTGRFPRGTSLLLVAAAAAGAVLAGVVTSAVVEPEPPPPAAPVEAVELDSVAPQLELAAGLVDHTWGMEIDLVGTGFEPGSTYQVMVRDETGQRYDSGAFVGVGANQMTCELSAAVLRADAVAFTVRDEGGRIVARADLRA